MGYIRPRRTGLGCGRNLAGKGTQEVTTPDFKVYDRAKAKISVQLGKQSAKRRRDPKTGRECLSTMHFTKN